MGYPIKIQRTVDQEQYIRDNYATKPVGEIVKHLKVSTSTYFKWKREMELPLVSNCHKPKPEPSGYNFSWTSNYWPFN